jgi:hypothetical protein
MAGTYFTPCTPDPVAAFLVRLQSCVKLGTQALYGSLKTTGWTYTAYEASIGLNASSFDLGLLGDLKWSHKPEYGAVEAFNISDDPLYELTGEETLLTVQIKQLDPRIIEFALGTGHMYTLGVERLLTFGGGCAMRNRPIAVEFINDACNAPSAQDMASGLTGGCLTIYNCFVQSGLEWAMAAKEVNTVDLELQALPVLARARGNRLGSLYLY